MNAYEMASLHKFGCLNGWNCRGDLGVLRTVLNDLWQAGMSADQRERLAVWTQAFVEAWQP